jgi:hypothetical protein
MDASLFMPAPRASARTFQNLLVWRKAHELVLAVYSFTAELEVDVVTLDQLADRYGIPTFVEIHAEGYDDHVLRGMAFRPPALSSEDNRLLPTAFKRQRYLMGTYLTSVVGLT